MFCARIFVMCCVTRFDLEILYALLASSTQKMCSIYRFQVWLNFTNIHHTALSISYCAVHTRLCYLPIKRKPEYKEEEKKKTLRNQNNISTFSSTMSLSHIETTLSVGRSVYFLIEPIVFPPRINLYIMRFNDDQFMRNFSDF